MRTKKLIKTLYFREQDREDVDLGAGARLNGERNCLQLFMQPSGLYPLDEDIIAKSRFTDPKAARQWLGFDVRASLGRDASGNAVTSLGFRLETEDETQYWWDGAAWDATTDPGDWNTEDEIAANIPTFGHRGLRVVINLRTDSPLHTPRVFEIKLLYEAVLLSFEEDILFRSLIPRLRRVQSIGRAVYALPEDAAAFLVTDLRLETGYNVKGVDSVFNYDGDPLLLENLLDSFDANTGTVTLTEELPANTNVWVHFLYEPEVAFNTSQDYVEQARLPAIVVEEARLEGMRTAMTGDDYVANKANATAVVVPGPEQGDLFVTLLVMTEKSVDQQRLTEDVCAELNHDPFVHSTAIDERYSLTVLGEFSASGDPGQEENRVARVQLVVHNFCRWLRPAFDDHITARITTAAGQSEFRLRHAPKL